MHNHFPFHLCSTADQLDTFLYLWRKQHPEKCPSGALLGVFSSAFLYPVDQFLLGREFIVHGLHRCAEAGFLGFVQLGNADAQLAHILLRVRFPPCPAA